MNTNIKFFLKFKKILIILFLLGSCIGFVNASLRGFRKFRSGSVFLHPAVFEGRIDKVRILIDAGANVNDVNNEGKTPLHIAVSMGHAEIVKFLIENRAGLYIEDSEGKTPVDYSVDGEIRTILKKKMIIIAFFKAVAAGRFSEVREVLEVAYQLIGNIYLIVNSVNLKGKTPLHVAALKGYTDIVKYLVENGTDINISDNEGKTPLRNAAFHGHIDIVRYLVENGASFNVVDDKGRTALCNAVFRGRTDVVKYLVENDPDSHVNAKYVSIGHSLHRAVFEGRINIVRFLVYKGADVNDVNNEGKTTLHIAVSMGHTEIVKFLIENRSGFYIEDSEGKTPVDYSVDGEIRTILKKKMIIIAFFKAVAAGRFSEVREVLEVAYQLIGNIYLIVNSVNLKGKTPLHVAALKGYTDIVKYLVENGTDINISDNEGKTPLRNAAFHGHIDIVRYLVENGASFNVVDDKGRTALGSAIFSGHRDLVKYLVENGAKIISSQEQHRRQKEWCRRRRQEYLSNVKYLILNASTDDERKLFANATNNPQKIPLEIASFIGDFEMVCFLIDNGANPCVLCVDNQTLLHFAISNHNQGQNKNLIYYLLEYYPELITIADSVSNRNPLHLIFRLSKGRRFFSIKNVLPFDNQESLCLLTAVFSALGKLGPEQVELVFEQISKYGTIDDVVCNFFTGTNIESFYKELKIKLFEQKCLFCEATSDLSDKMLVCIDDIPEDVFSSISFEEFVPGLNVTNDSPALLPEDGPSFISFEEFVPGLNVTNDSSELLPEGGFSSISFEEFNKMGLGFD